MRRHFPTTAAAPHGALQLPVSHFGPTTPPGPMPLAVSVCRPRTSVPRVEASGAFSSGERHLFAIELGDEAVRCSARVDEDWRVRP